MLNQFRSELSQIENGAYHREISLPVALIKPFVGQIYLDYTAHARRAAFNDRYGIIDLPACINVHPSEVVKVEVKNGRIEHALIRRHYDADHDLCIAVLLPLGGYVVAKTVWLNLKSDQHATLRREDYRLAA